MSFNANGGICYLGPSSPKATSVQHYHPGPGRKPLHPVQRYGSKGTVEMSLASRIALGNTGESCSPAAIFLTDSGKKHIDDSKRHHNKVIKKRVRRNKLKKLDQAGGENTVMNVERSLVQGVRFTTSENNPGGENNGWVSQLCINIPWVSKYPDFSVVYLLFTCSPETQLRHFFPRKVLVSVSKKLKN